MHHTEFYPCVNCVTTKFKQLIWDVYEKCYPSIEKNVLIEGECNKRHNTDIKIAKRNLRHAEKKNRQDKTNKLKHNEFRWLRQLKGETVSQAKTLYYKEKLNECGEDSSKIYDKLNILLRQNKNFNISPSGQLPRPLASDFKIFLMIK